MANKLTAYERLQRKYIKKTDHLFTDKDGKDLLELLSRGRNSYIRFDRFESSAMDLSWIKRIEDCIPQIGEIVQNPKKTIQTLSEVVEVEKVKKTTRESVQHLASHTQFIKSVDENRNVTPSKILNIYNDDFYAIYENKFIATLLRHLLIFVEKRYDYILHQATLKDVQLLYFKNVTSVEGTDIEIETKIRYSKPALDFAAAKMKGFLKRIEEIRKYLKFYMNTEFMKILSRERDVRNPILQTNIIRKNPAYHKCYLLWLFIERYREAGIEVKVEEKYSELTKKEMEEINRTLAIDFITLKGRNPSKLGKKKGRILKPEILNTLDDDAFRQDAKYVGPLEFVRVDETYRKFEDTLNNINPHPTKAMKEYDKEKYDENKLKRERRDQVIALKGRSATRIKQYQEEEEKRLEIEKQKAQLVDEIAESEIHNEALDKLTKARTKLAKSAKADRNRR